MRSCGRACLTVLLALGILAAGGCGGGSGESLLTAGAKIAAGQISTLTAGEILLLRQFLAAQGYVTPTLTEEQAAALAQFLQANGINTVEDVNRVIQQAATDPGSITLPPGFVELFLGTEFTQLTAT